VAQGVLGASYAATRRRPNEAQFRYRVRARLTASVLAEGLGRGPLRVVDFGTADGLGLVELARLLPGSYCGIEASAELIAAAPPLPAGVTILRGDVTRVPAELEGGSMDAVTALALLEHLPDPLAAMSEACRLLRPGGLFVATCPQGHWDRLATRLGLLSGDQHEQRLGRRELQRLAAAAGLEVVAFRRFMWAPVGTLPYLRIRVSPALALGIDRWVGRLRLFGWSFVNQLLVARRPE
jgi:SAM-dependent methyltransferase